MSTDAGPKHPVEAPAPKREAFELDRFAWGGPDRLEIAGRFVDLQEPPAAAPVLVVRGAGPEHRLPAVPDSWPGPPQDGQPWQAAFAWQEAPEPFATARLELGDAVVVALPEPGARRQRFRHHVLEVRRLPKSQAPPAPGARAQPDRSAERLRLETELLTSQQQIRELEAQAAVATDDLAQARQALEAERGRHAADAERFRAGIAQVRSSAEEAMAAEAAVVERLAAEADTARAEAVGLRERIGALEREYEASVAGVAGAREAAEAARADTERLLARLESLRSALGDRD
jgi:hypothetical protein